MQLDQRGMPNDFPIRFTDVDGDSRAVCLLRDADDLTSLNLTADQQAKLEVVSDERREFQHAAAVERILNLLDDELFFTSEQRDQLRKLIPGRINLDRTCYSLRPQSYYLSQLDVRPLLRSGPQLDLLSEIQRKRAADISDANSLRYSRNQCLIFRTNEGMHTWHDRLKVEAREEFQHLQTAVAVRESFIHSGCSLSDSDRRHLLVAGKGAIDEVVTEWKETSSNQLQRHIDQAARFRGNIAFAIQLAEVSAIDTNELWVQTVASVAPDADSLFKTRARGSTQS
ncbi:MAG: hypothetical protein R3C49_20650 [Planctomycetaceae bacterium]